jgi:hypothetical protein
MSTTVTGSRALSVASVHIDSINASRKKCGLPALTLAELTREFADTDRAPVRAKAVVPATRSNQAAIDAEWGGIVARLNKAAPASRTPIAAGPPSPASTAAAGRVDAAVDWSAIATDLNREAGLSDRRAR